MRLILQFTLAHICLCVVYGLPEPEAALGAENIATLVRVKRAGACTTTADCVAGNVCSKWGWCQWTDIYGSDGPSQGSAAPDGGKSGQCVTSADCASRVPYCSKLGFCHGGRLPFDEAQIEIPDGDKSGDLQPQGYINNNPKKNNPILKNSQGSNGRKSGTSPASRKSANSQAPRNQRNQNSNNRKTNNRKSSNSNNRNRSNNKANSANGRRGSQKKNGGRSKSAPAPARTGSGSKCQGGSLDRCVESCIPIQQVKAYGACVEKCGRGC